MESLSPDDRDVSEKGDGTPVCMKCFRPVNLLENYCPNCGEATGNLSHYLPLSSICWQARVWGQAWRQMWSKDISIPGRRPLSRRSGRIARSRVFDSDRPIHQQQHG